jgi:hypothetical protein
MMVEIGSSTVVKAVKAVKKARAVRAAKEGTRGSLLAGVGTRRSQEGIAPRNPTRMASVVRVDGIDSIPVDRAEMVRS